MGHRSGSLFRLIFSVIKTERRLKVELVFETKQLPSDLVVIAAVLGIGKHSNDGHGADEIEELTLFNPLEHLGLLRGAERGKFAGLAESLSGLLLKFSESFDKKAPIGSSECCKSSL